MNLRAAIYARISSDRTGDEAGVTRQLEDCRTAAARHGWTVAGEYVENDRSAFGGKARPVWTRMLGDAEDGAFDAIVAWHDDRLWRDVIEQRTVFALCAEVGVTSILTTRLYDTGSPDDSFLSGIQALIAERESVDKSRRIRRKHLELAQAGKVANGGPRPFGYLPDRVTIDPAEAARIRDAAERIAAGESMASVIRDWTKQGVSTVTGGRWRTTTFRRMIASPRIAGLRQHHGEVIGDADWPAIIDVALHRAVHAALDGRRNAGVPRTYLLSGLVSCGRCDATLRTKRSQRKGRQYWCQRAVDHDGCGRLAVMAEPVEELVSAQVLAVLSSPHVVERLSGMPDEHRRELHQQLTADEEALRELSRMRFVDRALSVHEYVAARDPLVERIADTKQRLAATVFRGADGPLEELWPAQPLGWRRALVEMVVDTVTVAPATPGINRFDPGRVTVTWRA